MCETRPRSNRRRARVLPATLAAWRWYRPDGTRRPMPYCALRTTAAAQFPIQFRHRLKPIHLTFLAPVVALRHEHLPPAESHILLPLLHVSPHGWLRDRMARVLFAQPCPDAVCRVPLLPRRLPVAFQHPVDSLLHRI